MVWTAVTLLTAACVYDDGGEVPKGTDAPDNRTWLNVGFSLPMTLAETGEGGGYVSGEGYENYIDTRDRGYRIYFFDNTGKYLARFVPMMVFPSGNRYEVAGVVPDEIAELSEFKLVVLANWPSYPDAVLVPGAATIDDLCNDASAQFGLLPNFELNPDKGLTIPFFGIHHYTGVTFKKGRRTVLEEPVALLRAMAKVEVEVNIPGVSLSGIGLRGYNSRGFCAPGGVCTHTEYDHSGNWEQDYVKTPHLVDGENDAAQGETLVPLFRKYGNDGTHLETWVAYVPEYRNLAEADGRENYKARIELQLDVQADTTHEIYFADYDSNGRMVADSYFDILRNNCYRFVVTVDKGLLVVQVKKWEHAYDNAFIFD